MRYVLGLPVLSVLLATACSSTSATNGGAGGTLQAQARQELAACRGGASDDALDDALEVTTDFKESCHELVVCGGLAATLSVSVVELFVQAALGAAGKGGLTFDGTKTYASNPSGPGTKMNVTLHLAGDTSFGKAGDAIPFDLTKVESYFKGAKLTAEGSVSTSGVSAKVKVTYDALGPAFELLGIPAPAGPSVVTLDAKAISRSLGAVKLRAETHVDDKQGHATFVYDMTSPETTLGALADGGPLDYRLAGVTGGRADLGQTLRTTTWDVKYVGGKVGKLDGTIGFAIDGGKVPHRATFAYPASNEPKITLACP